jgi:uncharacterized protein YjbJ (UPF0337 family)
MNKDRLVGKWHELKGKVREKWAKLTHDDVEMINGKTENLSGQLQKKYGWSKEQAEREINQWCDSCERGGPSEHRKENRLNERENRDVNEPAWRQEGVEENVSPQAGRTPQQKIQQGQSAWHAEGANKEKLKQEEKMRHAQEEQKEKKRKAG